MRSGRIFSLKFCSQGIKAIKEGMSCLILTFLSFHLKRHITIVSTVFVTCITFIVFLTQFKDFANKIQKFLGLHFLWY